MDFVSRARTETNDAANRRIWRSLNRCYRVVESKSLFGLSTVYFAMVRVDLPSCTWDLISTHRKRARALAACEKHAAR